MAQRPADPFLLGQEETRLVEVDKLPSGYIPGWACGLHWLSSPQLMSFSIQAGVLMICTIRSGWRAVSRHIRQAQGGGSMPKHEAVGVMCVSFGAPPLLSEEDPFAAL